MDWKSGRRSQGFCASSAGVSRVSLNGGCGRERTDGVEVHKISEKSGYEGFLLWKHTPPPVTDWCLEGNEDGHSLIPYYAVR